MDGTFWIGARDTGLFRVNVTRGTPECMQVTGLPYARINCLLPIAASTDGLPSAEGVKRSRSVVEDDRGRVWFSLNQGISFLQPSAFARPAFPVTIRLDGMLADGKPIASASDIRVPAGRHRLTFLYAGVNVSNPEGVRYRYRLDNVDSAWSEPTVSREIDYTNVHKCSAGTVRGDGAYCGGPLERAGNHDDVRC